MAQQAVAYFRVSTQRQGVSGLGLEAQRASVEGLAAQHGYEIVAEYTEVESGRKARRPQLTAALEQCRADGTALVFANWSRVGRNLAFTSALLESGVEFRAADMPQANIETIQIINVMNESYARSVSENTRAALAAAKARGVELGNPENLTYEAQVKGADARLQGAKDYYVHEKKVYGYARMMRDNGMSYRAIAARLNKEGYKTRGDSTRPPSKFYANTVRRILMRGNGDDDGA